MLLMHSGKGLRLYGKHIGNEKTCCKSDFISDFPALQWLIMAMAKVESVDQVSEGESRDFLS